MKAPISFSENNYNNTEIIFISKSEKSKDELDRICNAKGYTFKWWKIIHDLDKIIDISNNKKHIIVIFEDMSPFINSADKKSNTNMIDFLHRSRHSNISIISIMHGIRHSLSNRNSFERIFLDNCSGLFFLNQ